MSNYDWSSFVTRINVNAPIEKLYWCRATREGMEYWFLRLSEFTKPDGILRPNDDSVQKEDVYRWRWHGWSDETYQKRYFLQLNCRGSK